MKKIRPTTFSGILTTTALCLAACVCCQQREEPVPIPVNPIEQYRTHYREQLAEFKSRYPEALAAFREAIIFAYASLPETGYVTAELPLELDRKVWNKLAASPAFEPLPKDAHRATIGCPHGVYVALWEEIAAETDTSDTSENLQRRKAICNLFNYELALDESGMPPGVEDYISPHREHSDIFYLPHPKQEIGMCGNMCYVRREALSAEQQTLAVWFSSERARIRENAQFNSIVFVNREEGLLTEYYQRLQAIKLQQE